MKNFFFVESRLIEEKREDRISFYSNTERKGQYTRWVDGVHILDLISTVIVRTHGICIRIY